MYRGTPLVSNRSCHSFGASASMRKFGKSAPTFLRNSRALSRSLAASTVAETNCTSLAYFLCIWTCWGKFFMQGGHQVAHTSTAIILPLCDLITSAHSLALMLFKVVP